MEKNRTADIKKGTNFIIQGSILAVAGIVVRIIGLIYRIPMIRIIGDEGMGYYSTAFNIYSIMLLLSSYSLPLAVSKMISARVGNGQYKNVRRILKAALGYATIVGCIGFCITWFGADFFANKVFALPFAVYALKVLAPTIWIMAYLGVFRGYFQGFGTMVPTAISQVFEQIINAVISVVAAAALFSFGMKSALVYERGEYPTAFGAAGGTLGTGAGALTAFLFLGVLLLSHKKSLRRLARRDRTRARESYSQITGILIMTVIPVILSTAVYNVSSIIDNGIFGQSMLYFGSTEKEAATLYGIYSGRYHLLINVPIAIANALSSSLIPELSRAAAARDKGQISEKISTAIRFSMIVAIPSTVGITVLAGPIITLLFGYNSIAVNMTIVGSLTIAFYSLSTVTNAVLQGINHMNLPIRNALISLAVHVVVLLIMLFGLKLGVYSIVFANMLFGLVMCILNSRSISRCLNYRQELKKSFVIPSVCSVIMGVFAYAVHFGIYKLISNNAVSTAAAVLAAVVIYAVLLLKLKGIDEAEIYHMPKGVKLVKLLKGIHLI